MRRRKTNETKDDCIAQFSGHIHRERSDALLKKLKSEKKKDVVFVSSKTLFPKRKELLIEVDRKSTTKQRNEIITRRMTAKMIE
jgi:hypothetical protein